MEQWIENIKNMLRDGFNMIPESIRIERFMTIILSILMFLFMIFLIQLYLYFIKKIKYEKEFKEISLNLISSVKMSMNYEAFINQCLDVVCRIIIAQSYGFYLIESKNDKYSLKSVKYLRDDLSEVGPSYAGLVPYKKEQYIQPVSVQNQDIPTKTTTVTDGKVPLLVIPIGNNKAMIRIFPVKKISKKLQHKLDYFANIAGIALEILLEADEIKSKISTVAVSENAVNRVVNTIGSEDGLLYTFIGLCLKKTGADSGFFIKKQMESIEALHFVSLPRELEVEITEDIAVLYNMYDISGSSDMVHLNKSQSEYYKLPPYLTMYQIESATFIDVTDNGIKLGVIVLFYKEGNTNQDFGTEKVKAIQYTKNKFQELFGVQNVMKILSESLQDTMQGLMQLLDNIQPYTVGYSELMARFSYIIAEELGLPEDEKKDIYLAASLSNIGVLGLSNDIFFKTGRYSEVEYEAMKFHAEAGARIIEASLGSRRVADYVRYHHERMDGLGYPAGIKGNDIPLGARIIAVVQFFLAKINGREGRDPVSFNDALKSLEISSDTQLDRECVNALISWVEKKRSSTPDKNRSLGRCWDMRCSSVEICMDCPVYKKENINCWEYESKGIKCSGHGNTCKTCYIRTEVQGR